MPLHSTSNLDVLNIDNLKSIYFLGIGGIGMSAIAAYFLEKGCHVQGYDRQPSAITEQLILAGARIDFDIPIQPLSTPLPDLVIYTPAIASTDPAFQYFASTSVPFIKRSEALQRITQNGYTICVAGTHGKTTISAMIAHIARFAKLPANAFLGGITVNYATNFWSGQSNTFIVEADEYDRSFLKLNPSMAVVSATDVDHLDIYQNHENIQTAFQQFVAKVKPTGYCLLQLEVNYLQQAATAPTETYSLNNRQADWFTKNIRYHQHQYWFEVYYQNSFVAEFRLPIAGLYNIENALAAIAIAHRMKIETTLVQHALMQFKGVKRRFEYVIKTDQQILIDDYAHHPKELESLIQSVKEIHKEKLTIVFQPHLYSRTRDLAPQFANALSLADEVILLPIYPAREAPLPSVSSHSIGAHLKIPPLYFENKQALLQYIQTHQPKLLVMAGAGSIDEWVHSVKSILNNEL